MLHVRELEPLARQIDADMPDERMDARSIARFQAGLLQFMENALGPQVCSPAVLMTHCPSQIMPFKPGPAAWPRAALQHSLKRMQARHTHLF
jgi:hypothetical protein